MSSDDEAADSRVVIGISFGNSYSSIACIQGSDAQVIANEEGDRQIPSILAYVDGEEFQGTQAKSQLVRNASNTCAGFRDFIGKEYAPPRSDLAGGRKMAATDLRLLKASHR